MKRLKFSTRLIFVILGVAWLAAMMLVLRVGTLGAARGEPQVARVDDKDVLLPMPKMMPELETTPPPPFTCNVTITTTDYVIASTNKASPSYVGNLTKLGLVNSPNTLGPQQTLINYFQLYPADIGTEYTLDALPTNGTSYDLGIYVYYSPGPGQYVDVYTRTDYTSKSATATFVATQSGPYIFAVFQKTLACSGGTYYLQFESTGPTATPTGTATRTPTPTNTPPPGNLPDQFDNPPGYNDIITHATQLGQNSVTGLTLCNLALCDPNVPNEDRDWYVISGVAGYHYTVSAATDGAYPVLNMKLYKPDRTTLVGQVLNSKTPTIEWDVNTAGNYYVFIWRAAGSLTNGSYHLNWTAPGPTVTPTPGPEVTETPVPGIDAFEPNYDFDHAASIGLNVKYTGINFVPLPGQTENNDYFKIRVKRGMLVTCQTVDLSPGTDTNMILYDDNRNGLAGNDDVDPAHGDLSSRVTVSINYDGFLYILVGQGYSVPNFQAASYNYALQCTTPGNALTTPTNTPVGGGPTYTPIPSATPLPPPTTTATPMPPISVRALPTPTPSGPAQHMVTADLRVSYDANGNGAADPGEGVVGLHARVYDDSTGALLAQGFTDDTGHAVFTVPAAGSIRVVVPYLGFETIVPPNGAAIPVLITARELPKLIP